MSKSNVNTSRDILDDDHYYSVNNNNTDTDSEISSNSQCCIPMRYAIVALTFFLATFEYMTSK